MFFYLGCLKGSTWITLPENLGTGLFRKVYRGLQVRVPRNILFIQKSRDLISHLSIEFT